MSLRRKKPADSLYMLLDTMCNAFGGIILLAVLVVLLTSKETGQSKSSNNTQEMLRRRLAIAQDNLQRAIQLRNTWQAKVTEEGWKDQVALLATRQQLQEEIKAILEMVAKGAKELDASAVSDPAERLKTLNSQLMEAQVRKLEAQNSLAASKDNMERLKMRIAAMEKQTTDLVKDSQRPLRLPKEHASDDRVFWIVARYDRIYLTRDSDLDPNETDIDWTPRGTKLIAEPKIGRGIELPSGDGRLRNFFKQISRADLYLGFHVYEDSFPAFLRAKQIAIESGLQYGWDPVRISDGPLVLVSDGTGTRPKPQ